MTLYDVDSEIQKEIMMSRQIRSWIASTVVVAAALTIAAPAEAQREFEPLFDKFNFKAEFSWVGLATDIRLDSEALGRGTTLSFENDLDLGNREAVPTLAFEWQIAKRHRLGVRWQDISRDSSAQALTEIQWGDQTIPINANIFLAFNINQAFVDYTYYPWVKEKWALGFGLGFRVMELQATLSFREEGNLIEESSDVKGTAPLPYFYTHYRRLLGDSWRLNAGVGWLYLSIDDISGGQYIGRLGIEYLAGRRWAFGAAINLSTIDVDWDAIQHDEMGSLLSLALDMDINDISLFARVRF
jgi:hypothetical protein